MILPHFLQFFKPHVPKVNKLTAKDFNLEFNLKNAAGLPPAAFFLY
jgi:hypothetical protein